MWSTPQATIESMMTCLGTEPKAFEMSNHATNLLVLQRRAASMCCASKKWCPSTLSNGEKPFCVREIVLHEHHTNPQASFSCALRNFDVVKESVKIIQINV
ncbi:hypothetical protein TNCT_409281 [Trichonephila clavata]|uniref:Uncharacterized protein n=1 Tax=Trichonephila clavata TaxID=2740835 RepID=A0A8X6F586_TRICU|nr:hypothetical protein TNCT_409281 [Trichonephila clavata]